MKAEGNRRQKQEMSSLVAQLKSREGLTPCRAKENSSLRQTLRSLEEKLEALDKQFVALEG